MITNNYRGAWWGSESKKLFVIIIITDTKTIANNGYGSLLAVICLELIQHILPETEVCFNSLVLPLKYITMQNALFAGIKYIYNYIQ